MHGNVYRIVLLGSSAVGKSCLTMRFVSNRFVEEYTPTLEDSYRKKLNVDNEVCVMDIFDTAGEEDYQSVRTEYIKRGDGFICVYSITSVASFEIIRDIYDEILRFRNNYSVPAVLVGNKHDLSGSRCVKTETAQAFAREVMGGAAFYETSAKTCRHVTDAFYAVVKRIRHARAKQKQSRNNTTARVTPHTRVRHGAHHGCVLL